MKYKNIYKRLFFLFVMSGFIFACNDKDENLKSFTVTEGALISADASSGAFLFGVTTETSFTFSTSTNEGFGVASVVVYKRLFTTVGNSEEINVGTYTTFPATFSATADELFADVPVDGNVLTEGDLSPGDQWVFRYEINMADGRTLADGSEYALTFTCPSDMAGTYLATNDFCAGSDPYTVVITETTTPGVYSIDRLLAGWLDACTGNSGIYIATTIQEVCGSIVPTTHNVSGVNWTTDATSAWDAGSGTLTIIWTDDLFGLDPITGTFVRQ